MSESREVARVSNRDLQTMPFEEALDAYTPRFVAALPDHISPDRFKAVIVTAVNMNPDLRSADRRSLFNSCVKCAHDGLYPDGRQAALVVFNTKVKARDEKGMERDRWVPLVQYIPMTAGLIQRMRNTGQVLSAAAEVVYRNDAFSFVKGENPRIEHTPCQLDKDHGEAVGAYAIIKLTNGEVLREVMSRREIEKVRSFSKTGQNTNSPWSTSWDEMARKTVLRRCSKWAPTGSDVERLLARDEEGPEEPERRALTAIPPRPARAAMVVDLVPDEPSTTEAAPERKWAIVGPDGEVREFEKPEDAAEFFERLLYAARSTAALGGLWEDNRTVIREMPGGLPKRLDTYLHECFEELARVVTMKAKTEEKSAEQEKEKSGTLDTDTKTPGGPATARGSEEPGERGKTAAPASEGPAPERKSMRIEVPTTDGKPNYRAWMVTQFMPRARKMTNAADLAFLRGDNEASLAAYKQGAETAKLTDEPQRSQQFFKELDDLAEKLA